MKVIRDGFERSVRLTDERIADILNDVLPRLSESRHVDAFTTSPRRRPGIFRILETFDGEIFLTDDVVKMRRETSTDDSTH